MIGIAGCGKTTYAKLNFPHYKYVSVDKKQKSEEPDKRLSFMMYYNFFNIGIEGLIKSMPEEFRYTLQDQIRPVLLLMQAITRFTLQSGSKKKVPFVHAPDFMIRKGLAGETLQ